jgi:putative oxidoreductase
MKIVKTIIFILFALMFINAGLNKFLNYMPVPELTPAQQQFFGAFMQIKWLMPLVAVAEIVGGLLCLSNRFRALGAIIILPVMIGIFVHHATMDPSGMLIASVLMIINIWIIADNWRKYRPLIA